MICGLILPTISENKSCEKRNWEWLAGLGIGKDCSSGSSDSSLFLHHLWTDLIPGPSNLVSCLNHFFCIQIAEAVRKPGALSVKYHKWVSGYFWEEWCLDLLMLLTKKKKDPIAKKILNEKSFWMSSKESESWRWTTEQLGNTERIWNKNDAKMNVVFCSLCRLM